MGGAPAAPPLQTGHDVHPTFAAVTALTQPTAAGGQARVCVFQDDFPPNGENDAGGQVGTTARQRNGSRRSDHPFDDAGGTGMPPMTYDMPNMRCRTLRA
jgi:hypothetical protein